MNKDFYQLSMDGINSRPIPLADFKGKTILIVNTASKCGFTRSIQRFRKTLSRTQGQWTCCNRLSVRPVRPSGARIQRRNSNFL